MKPWHTVVQLDEFVRMAKPLMSDDEREKIVDLLAANPESGTALGGGLWKLRVARAGGGKSGGFRTIYLFVGDHVPVFLLSVFAKSQKANLTAKERTTLIEAGKSLVLQYGAAG